MYYYDTNGWLSATPIPGRETDVVPMAAEGNKRPNFTGYVWVLQEYAPPPVESGPRKLTKLEYMNRFTDVELVGIYTAAKTEVLIEIWLEKFKATTPNADGTAIDLDDPRTISGLQALEAAGLLAAGRAEEIWA